MADLRWMQPAGSAPVDYWNVYRDEEMILMGVIEEPVAGLYATAIPGWPYEASYTMTAVNAGGESERSNVIVMPEVPTGWGLLVLVAGLLCLRRRHCGGQLPE